MNAPKLWFEGHNDPVEYTEEREPPCEHIAALLSFLDENRLKVRSGCGCCYGLHVECERCNISIQRVAIWRSDDEGDNQ